MAHVGLHVLLIHRCHQAHDSSPGGKSGQASSCDSAADISLARLSTGTQHFSSAGYLAAYSMVVLFLFSPQNYINS